MIGNWWRLLFVLVGAALWLGLAMLVPDHLADVANFRNIERCRALSGPTAHCFTDITSENYVGMLAIGLLLLAPFVWLLTALFVRKSGKPTTGMPVVTFQLKGPVPLSAIIATVALILLGLFAYPILRGAYAWHHYLWLALALWLVIGIAIRLLDAKTERAATPQA